VAICEVKKQFVFIIAETREKINLLSKYRHKDHSMPNREKPELYEKKKRAHFITR